jgi:hypothetical protein
MELQATREHLMIDFEYDLHEIVQMDDNGSLSLRAALIHMPSRVGPLGVLWREAGKIPSFFNAEQIQALVDQHKAELEAGNPIGHREADEDDF